MANRKCKCPPAGAPEWVMTYGDMMSLLLCFFIILFSLSEIKKEDKYRAVVEEVQKAFGMKGGGGDVPTPMDPTMSLIERIEHVQLQRKKEKETSHDADPGIDGRRQEVTTIREGLKFAVGGRITFETGSAKLSREAREQLRQAAKLFAGHTNKIELRGHASPMEVKADPEGVDLWALSYARAAAVRDYLTSTEVGIRPQRIRLMACADHEPVRQREYDSAQTRPNRRVEILVTEALVQSLARPETTE